MLILLFGAPGVGKGTQAELLKDRKGFIHLSTGDAFRKAIKEQTEVGKLAKSYMDRGELVPDSVVIQVVDEALGAFKTSQKILLDGYPRTVEQAKALEKVATQRGMAIQTVLNFSVPETELMRRMLARGRADDTREIIENRMKVYAEKTQPLLEFYTERGKLMNIDGSREVETVFKDVCGHLGA